MIRSYYRDFKLVEEGEEERSIFGVQAFPVQEETGYRFDSPLKHLLHLISLDLARKIFGDNMRGARGGFQDEAGE